MKPASPRTRAAIVADYTAGMSSIAVARKYGRSSTAVLRYVKAAGVGRSPEEAKARQREYREARLAEEARGLAAEEAREEAALVYDGGWELRGLVKYPLFPEQRSA